MGHVLRKRWVEPPDLVHRQHSRKVARRGTGSAADVKDAATIRYFVQCVDHDPCVGFAPRFARESRPGRQIVIGRVECGDFRGCQRLAMADEPTGPAANLLQRAIQDTPVAQYRLIGRWQWQIHNILAAASWAECSLKSGGAQFGQPQQCPGAVEWARYGLTRRSLPKQLASVGI